MILVLSLISCGKETKKVVEKKETVKLVKSIELKETTVDYIKDYNGELKPKNEVAIVTPNVGDLKIAEANYIKDKYNFDILKVIAKIDVIVTDLDLKEFEKTSPNQKLLTVIDNSIMELTIAVSGKDLENSKIDDKADIFVEEIENCGLYKRL